MMNLKRIGLLAPLMLLAFLPGAARPAVAGTFGPELRAYPAGLVFSLRAEVSVGDADVLLAQAGYNATDRRDWGEHDDESGGGGGLGAGWLRRQGSWVYGVRLDYWQLGIDWKDPGRSGSTDTGVVQPSFTGGYRREFSGQELEATLSFGREINVGTDGEDVGEGWILLAGFGVFFGF